MNAKILTFVLLWTIIVQVGRSGTLRDLVENDTRVAITDEYLADIQKLAGVFELGEIHGIRFCYIHPSSLVQAIATHETALDGNLVAQTTLNVTYDKKLKLSGCYIGEHNYALVTLKEKQYKVATNLRTAQSVQERVAMFLSGSKSFENEKVKSSFLKLVLKSPTSLHFYEKNAIFSISFSEDHLSSTTVWFRIEDQRIVVTHIERRIS